MVGLVVHTKIAQVYAKLYNLLAHFVLTLLLLDSFARSKLRSKDVQYYLLFLSSLTTDGTGALKGITLKAIFSRAT